MGIAAISNTGGRGVNPADNMTHTSAWCVVYTDRGCKRSRRSTQATTVNGKKKDS